MAGNAPFHADVPAERAEGNLQLRAACSALCQLLQPFVDLLLHFQQIAAPLSLLLHGLLDVLQGQNNCVIILRIQKCRSTEVHLHMRACMSRYALL